MDQSPAAAAQRLAYRKRALISAVKTGDTESVVELLDEGVPVDIKDDEGLSLLHWAAQGGHVTTMRLLIRRGCNVDSVDDKGITPLHLAAAMGQTKSVRELIRKRASKSLVVRSFDALSHQAAFEGRNGNEETKLDAFMSVGTSMCGTPLHQASLAGHMDTAVAMLEEGCSVDVVNSAGFTVLHFAAQGGHVKLVKELVRRGCDVNAKEISGCTPLHSAAAHGRTEAVRELIKLGATKPVVYVASTFGTALHVAARIGYVETVVAMLDEGFPFDVEGSDGSTVLHAAAQGGHVEVVKELVGRGCDVNAEKKNGCTPLHSAAACGKAEVVRELIKLCARKSVVAGRYGTALHQATMEGDFKSVETLLEDECSEHDSVKHMNKDNDIDVINSFGHTPVMFAFLGGHVELFKLLFSKGGTISDRDKHYLSPFELCIVGGHANKLMQFCEACGIRNSGEGLKGALAALITQDRVDAHKVLCLCAFSGDSVFLEEQFIELVASKEAVMQALEGLKHLFFKGSEFLDKLKLHDENSLNPLHISLLAFICSEMGFAGPTAIGSASIINHTSFIKKLLYHPVLKETVLKNFPNGLSPLDLARQFGLQQIATLIEDAGGHPGVWAAIPKEIEVRHPLALPRLREAYASIKAIAEDGEHGLEFIKGIFSSVLQQPIWHPEAAIVGANIGAKTDDHEYKSLRKLLMVSVNDVSNLLVDDECKIGINAMLNHHKGGSIHFGISDDGIVEEGLPLEQNKVITKLREKVGGVLKNFWPPVESSFVQVEPVNLQNDKQDRTGNWRFDIVVKAHPPVVQLAQEKHGCYRHGAQNVHMTYGVFVQKIRAELACLRSPKPAALVSENGGEFFQFSQWDENAAAVVGANVGAEKDNHEYKSLMVCVDGVNQPFNNASGIVRRVAQEKYRCGINAMLNHRTGGSIHFGIHANGIVEEGLDLEQTLVIDELRVKVGEVLKNFCPPVESTFAQVEPVDLRNDKQEVTGRWRFNIVVKPHPSVVLLSQTKPAYYRQGPQTVKMTHDVLAQRVRQEPAGHLPHGY